MSVDENNLLSICLEGFLYGIYSGILVMYFQCQPNKSTGFLFYAIGLLYFLSTINFISDMTALILETRINVLNFPIENVQNTAAGCCDFLAQGILIYRCWIIWGQNIYVIIIPSFLSVAYLATWEVPLLNVTWAPLPTTSFVATMTVTGLTTGLIVFRILKTFLEVKASSTSVERNLGSARGTNLRYIIFLIIESGVTLLVTHLVCMLLWVVGQSQFVTPGPALFAFEYLIPVNQMFNGIVPTVILVRISLKLSFNDKDSFKEVVESLCFNNPPSDPDSDTLQRMGSMLHQDSEE